MDESILKKLYDANKNELKQDSYEDFKFTIMDHILNDLCNMCKNKDGQFDSDNRINIYKFIYTIKDSANKYCEDILKQVEDPDNELHNLNYAYNLNSFNISRYSFPDPVLTFSTNAPLTFDEFKEMSLEDLPNDIAGNLLGLTNE